MEASHPKVRKRSRNQAARSCSRNVGAGTRQSCKCVSLIHCFSRVNHCRHSRTSRSPASSPMPMPVTPLAAMLTDSVAVVAALFEAEGGDGVGVPSRVCRAVIAGNASNPIYVGDRWIMLKGAHKGKGRFGDVAGSGAATWFAGADEAIFLAAPRS